MTETFQDDSINISIHSMDFRTENIIRLQIRRRNEMSLMERFGILNIPKKDDTPECLSDDGRYRSFTGESVTCRIENDSGEISIEDKITGTTFLFHVMNRKNKSPGLKVSMRENEAFFGLGYRKTDELNLRGKAYKNHVTYGAAYGPQPFYMSNAGYGLFLNTTCDSYFDFGVQSTDEALVWSEDEDLDVFIFVGAPREAVACYTRLSGRPYLMPSEGYGLMFIGNEKETQFDILRDAEHFLEDEIPLSYIGLEPGWMETHYDASTAKQWNKERFYMPWWSDDRKQFQEETFIGALERKGIGLSLWLCCDYDIFYEEEKRLHESVLKDGTQRESNQFNSEESSELFTYAAPDFDSRAHTPIYMDKLTDRNEAWFEHLKKFIDDGVTAFKQDPAFVANDHPDRLYAGKYTDHEIHNIYISVLAKQVHEGYKNYTGKRPMHYTGTGYTGIQRWAPSWMCDVGGREEALMGILLSGMCGHMNVTCDLDIRDLQGIHFGFLLPWCQINSWASVLQPWYLEKERYESFRYYARLHERLRPYIYTFAHEGQRSGMPIVRALPLIYPHDEEAYKANREYMLGDSLLIGAFTDRIYLPEGWWYDYWTNKAYEGGRWLEISYPTDRGGYIFVKAGGILLMQSEDRASYDYDVIIYPGSGEISLYEDDGETFGYEKGAYAVTKIHFSYEGEECKVTACKRIGSYPGMPEEPRFNFITHVLHAID